MKRSVKLLAAIFATLLTVMLIAPVAIAQEALRVTIPFAFTANHQVLPAGSYVVKHQDGTWGPYLLLVNRSKGTVAAMLMAYTTASHRTLAYSSLVFYNSGHKYWLSEIRFAESNMTSQLSAQPKPEPTLAKVTEHPTTIEIATR